MKLSTNLILFLVSWCGHALTNNKERISCGHGRVQVLYLGTMIHNNLIRDLNIAGICRDWISSADWILCFKKKTKQKDFDGLPISSPESCFLGLSPINKNLSKIVRQCQQKNWCSAALSRKNPWQTGFVESSVSPDQSWPPSLYWMYSSSFRTEIQALRATTKIYMLLHSMRNQFMQFLICTLLFLLSLTRVWWSCVLP